MYYGFRVITLILEDELLWLVKKMDFAALNHINSSFKPVHILCALFGLSFFHYSSIKWIRWLNFAYSLIVFFVFTSFFLYRISSDSPKLSQMNAVGQSVIGIQHILGFLVVAAIYYKSFCCRLQFQNLMKSIEIIDVRFKSINIRFLYKSVAKKILFEVVLVLSVFGSSFLFFIIHYQVEDLFCILIELFVSINSLFVIYLNLITFINISWCLQRRFNTLKDFLIDVCAIDSGIGMNKSDVWKVKLLRRKSYRIHKQLKYIAQLYESLYECAGHLNNIFGLTNLAAMGPNIF